MKGEENNLYVIYKRRINVTKTKKNPKQKFEVLRN